MVDSNHGVESDVTGGHLSSLTRSIQSATSSFRNYLQDLYRAYLPLTEGAIADYIPELALAATGLVRYLYRDDGRTDH